MTEAAPESELQQFLSRWEDDPANCKKAFLELKSVLEQHGDTVFEFIPRPGVTYSLRAARKDQKTRPLFALIDVIDENPRWLSVCFYEDLVTDPDELGDLVFEGLLGEDGYCFDVDSFDRELVDYVCRRLEEAYKNAAS